MSEHCRPDAVSAQIKSLSDAGGRDGARRLLGALLRQELAEAIYPLEPPGGRFKGTLNPDSGQALRLQFLRDEDAAETAVLALRHIDGDLCRLIERANGGRGRSPDELAAWEPRERVRAAIVAADFMVDFVSAAGRRHCRQIAEALCRKFWPTTLDPEDAVSEISIKVIGALPGCWAYVGSALRHLYHDHAVKFGTLNEVSIDNDDEGGGEEPRDSAQDRQSDHRDRTLDSIFTKLRKEKLFGLLADVYADIPGMTVAISTRKKPKALDKSHQQLFDWWLSVDSCARISPELSVAEIAAHFGYSESTVKRRFTELQAALTQHPRYEAIRQCVVPTCRKNAPPDAVERFDLMVRTQWEKSHQVCAQWRRELEEESSGHFAAAEWPEPAKRKSRPAQDAEDSAPPSGRI